MINKNIKIILSWVFTVLIFIGFWHFTGLRKVPEYLGQVDPGFLSMAIMVSIFGHVVSLNIYYKKLLKVLGCNRSFYECLILRMGTMPIKSIVPFNLGDLSRPLCLKKIYGLSYDKGVLSVIIGYLLSASFYLICIIMGYLFLKIRGYLLGVLGLLFIAAMVLLYLQRLFLLKIFIALFEKIFAKNHKVDFSSMLIEKKIIAEIIAWFFSFELSKVWACFLIFKACAVTVPIVELITYSSLSLLLGMIPVTIMGLGTRESAIMALFAGFAVPEKLFVCGLLISLAANILPAFIGLMFTKKLLNKLLIVDVSKEIR